MWQIKNRLSVFDISAVILVLALSVLPAYAVLFGRGNGDFFTVTTPEGVSRYSLAEDRIFDVMSNGVRLTVAVDGGCVSVSEADCPDGVCVRTGSVSLPGQSIVCLPARAAVTVSEEEACDADWIFN